MKIFKDHGKATLKFENCNDHGSIQIYLNNKTVQVKDALTKNGYIAEFVYKKFDVLEVKEEEGAIIKISSMILKRREYFLFIKAILIIEILFCSFLFVYLKVVTIWCFQRLPDNNWIR